MNVSLNNITVNTTPNTVTTYIHCPYVRFNVQNEQHPEEYLKEQNDEVCSSEQFYQGISGPKEKL